MGSAADIVVESDNHHGPDSTTELLGALAAQFEDVQRTRKSAGLRAIAAEKNGQFEAAAQGQMVADALLPIEQKVSRALKKALRQHVLWPWLENLPGLAGPTTARLLAIIADPMRFPGRVCTEGHYHPETYGGETCGAEEDDGGDGKPGLCLAPVGPRRRGSGVRSLYHYLGLHVVNGKSPRKMKGQQGDWNVRGRTLVLQPDGIADQIVRQRTPKYRDIYDETKARLQRERGTVACDESGTGTGPALALVGRGVDSGGESKDRTGPASPSSRADAGGAANQERGPGVVGGADGALVSRENHGPSHPTSSQRVDCRSESEYRAGPLRPFQIDAIARKVAAKAFVGDLLMAWKNLSGADRRSGSDCPSGPAHLTEE